MQEKKEKSWKDYTGPDQVISSHEMKLQLEQEGKAWVNLNSRKIPSLSRYCEGFMDGELIVISGPTKNGKTLLAQSLTVEFCRQQEFPVWFTFEVPAKQFLSQFPELPLFYLPSKLKAHALPWIEERIQESFVKYRTRVIFLDHLHYLFDMARIRNPSIEIGTVIRKLKSMAVEMGLLVFLLCHTVKGKCEDLSYESIRDSSFVSQESDCVLMVSRNPQKSETAAEIRVEFHRRTGIMEKIISVHKEGNFLVETAPAEDRRYATN